MPRAPRLAGLTHTALLASLCNTYVYTYALTPIQGIAAARAITPKIARLGLEDRVTLFRAEDPLDT